MLKKILLFGGMSGAAAAVYYRQRLLENQSVTPDSFHAAQHDQIQQVLGQGAAGLKQQKVTFYRYTTCPFCGTVKSFLDYHKIPHDLVEVDPLFKTQLKGNNYSKVPQLRIGGPNGPILVDSKSIVDTLNPLFADTEKSNQKATKDDNKQQLLEESWRMWARERLVRIATVNINRHWRESVQSYSYLDTIDTIPMINKLCLKVVAGPLMYVIAQTVTKKKLMKAGHFDPTQLDERETLYREVQGWLDNGIKQQQTPPLILRKDSSATATITDGASSPTATPSTALIVKSERKFHGGDKPDLADLDIYGIISSIRVLPVYEDLKANTNVDEWMQRMDEVVDGEQARWGRTKSLASK